MSDTPLTDSAHAPHVSFRHSKRYCRDFPLGRCRFGDRCAFVHDPAPSCLPGAMHPVPALWASSPLRPSYPLLAEHFLSASYASYYPDGAYAIPSPTASASSSTASDETFVSACDTFSVSDHDTYSPRDECFPANPVPCPSALSPWSAPPSAVTPPAPHPTPVPFSCYSPSPPLPPVFSSQGFFPRGAASPLTRPPKSKPFQYKTKPCKFYNSTRSCVKGDRCTFIHDAEKPSRDGPSPGPARPLPAVNTQTTQARTTPAVLPLPEHGLPAKPSTAIDESRKRNYFPVTWRIIGGGVTLSGQRDLCQDYMAERCADGEDCRFLHPGEDELDDQVADSSVGLATAVYAGILRDLSARSSNRGLPTCAPRISAPRAAGPAGRATRIAAKKLTIVPPAPPGCAAAYSAHRFVDGRTLRDADTALRQAPSYPVPRGIEALSARALVRPVSTPPTPVAKNTKIIRLFSAEMP